MEPPGTGFSLRTDLIASRIVTALLCAEKKRNGQTEVRDVSLSTSPGAHAPGGF